jgi:hypothetical protein
MEGNYNYLLQKVKVTDAKQVEFEQGNLQIRHHPKQGTSLIINTADTIDLDILLIREDIDQTEHRSSLVRGTRVIKVVGTLGSKEETDLTKVDINLDYKLVTNLMDMEVVRSFVFKFLWNFDINIIIF